ncbi:MarR family transcriptional regulator [Ligilactobacillus sp. WILCCON 0076]|uniref:MarR family transcriptional regulator n=1 Tax=Ligilactobacillus ubinensis TaxID=2876789 RepID=A0A9X2FFT3_9LACO|nr:MarR family transcriptional regulator [Ligilactobacillus ubinensis]MCP0885754.1 MarR family transcriptional regulator [Ligilactobacillus ubinensis]
MVASADFYDELCLSVYTTNRYFHQLYAFVLHDDELTYLQYMVLLNVHQKADCSLADICKNLDLENNTLTPVVKKLLQKKWLLKQQSKLDKRRFILAMTPSANEKFAHLQQKIEKLQKKLIGNSTAEFEAILQQSHELNQRLLTVINELN